MKVIDDRLKEMGGRVTVLPFREDTNESNVWDDWISISMRRPWNAPPHICIELKGFREDYTLDEIAQIVTALNTAHMIGVEWQMDERRRWKPPEATED